MQAKARASPTGPSDLRKLRDLRFPKSHSGRAFLVPPTARQRKHGTINHPREGGLPDDIPTVGVQALDGASEGKGEGSLEFYLIPFDNSRARLQSSGEGSLCPIGEARRRKLSSIFGTRSNDLRIIQEQEANLEFVIARDSISMVRDQAKVTAPQGIEELYRWLATLPVKE